MVDLIKSYQRCNAENVQKVFITMTFKTKSAQGSDRHKIYIAFDGTTKKCCVINC